MFDNPNLEYFEKDKKTFFKAIYPFIDKLLPEKISKGIDKKATIHKGARIVPGVVADVRGNIRINCITSWGVHIGQDTMLGENVAFFTINHERNTINGKTFNGMSKPKPIYIGKNCWIGHDVIVLGGLYWR